MRQVLLLVCLGVVGFLLYQRFRPPVVDHCRQALEHLLRSPSTLNIVLTEVASQKRVTLTYDAENGFGAPVRSTIVCEAGSEGKNRLSAITLNDQPMSDDEVDVVNLRVWGLDLYLEQERGLQR